jgi:hypothetical protein
VAWVATGDARRAEKAAELAFKRRRQPRQKLPTLGLWLAAHGGLAQRLEAIDGSMYRAPLREGWAPGNSASKAEHPILRASSQAVRLMRGRLATGRRGDSAPTPIPVELWRSAVIIDHRRLGLILRLPDQADDVGWYEIDVPAAPFRTLGAKRGRRPAGLSAGARQPRLGEKTMERLRRKKALADKRHGIQPAPRRRGGGRPKGSRDVH